MTEYLSINSKSAMPRFLLLCGLLGFSPLSYALNVSPNLDVYALLDARLVYSDGDENSSFDGGLGKLRYSHQFSANLAEAAIILAPKLNEQLGLNVYAKYDAEQDFDLVEAFIHYQQDINPDWQFSFRGGVFFPQMSLENSERFWLSPYNITHSAINSWIGEEVRITGAEFKFSYQYEEHHFGWQGSVFALNDPVGSLLAWRGWAIHSQKTGVLSQIPLAALPEFDTGGVFFPSQDRWVDPFREIDRNVGFSTGLEWKYNNQLELHGLYYNSNAIPDRQDGSQYAWQSNFFHLGLKADIGGHFEILGQYLQGNSKMGPSMVNIDFWSYYLMLRKQLDEHRFSLRYEQFRVKDLDHTVNDNNNEHGFGITAAYSYQINTHHQLMLEMAHVKSERPMRRFFNRAAKQDETSLQFSYRLTW